MNGRELEVLFNSIYTLPDAYREDLAKAMSWEAMCYLLNGLSVNLSDLVDLDEIEPDGVG